MALIEPAALATSAEGEKMKVADRPSKLRASQFVLQGNSENLHIQTRRVTFHLAPGARPWKTCIAG